MSQPAVPDAGLAVRLLGGAAIEQAGRPLAHRAAHRHGLGLLALLATARGRLLSRDKVVAFLWPEADAETARHRLNVLLYDLRRTLGRDVLLSVNDDLRLDTGRVWVDVSRFLTATEQGDHAEAIALYRGPFLDGFYLPDGSEFEQWAAVERERLAKALSHAAEEHALEAERSGDLRLAAARWRRLVELDPLASRPVVSLMRALAAGGEPAEAIRVAEQHACRRAEDLGTSPDPAVRDLAERLRVSPPEPAAVVPAPAASFIPTGEAADPGEARPRQETSSARRSRSRRLIGVLAVSLLLVSLLPLVRSAPDAGGAGPGTRLVILPFVVRGSDRFAYLSDGMVDLLAITLDGVGSVRTADPHAVLAFVRRRPAEGGDPETGRQVAARFGARHFVLGTIVESGSKLEIQATLYDANGQLQVRAVGTAEEDGDIMPVVDGLTRQLISALYRSGPDRLSRLATTTTTSLPALKAYLQGEALLRVGEHKSAAESFRRATGQDSTFALAWYRLAVAAELTLQPREALAAAEGAVRHAARLPQRDSLLLVGWRAYARGDADDAEAVYRRILDLYPTETEAWLQLGEIGFHYGASRGVGIGAARTAFEEVLALDPDHEGALVHLARITAHAGDTLALTRYVDHLLARQPAKGVALEMRALRAFTVNDRDAIRRLEPEFKKEDSYAVMAALLSLFHAGNLNGIQWCAELLREPDRPPEVRTAGHLVVALTELARGRRDHALAAVARAEPLDPVRGLELRAIIATTPFLQTDPVELARVRAALAASLASEAANPVAESFFLPDVDRTRPLLRRYLLGLLNAQLGDPRAAVGYAEELERVISPASDPSLGVDLALGVRAEVDRLGGRAEAALRALQRIRERPRYQLVLPSPFDPRVRERFVRARLLEDGQRGEEARAVYLMIGRRSMYDLPYRAPAQLRLAPAHVSAVTQDPR